MGGWRLGRRRGKGEGGSDEPNRLAVRRDSEAALGPTRRWSSGASPIIDPLQVVGGRGGGLELGEEKKRGISCWERANPGSDGLLAAAVAEAAAWGESLLAWLGAASESASNAAA